ncbi:hypothetical protein UCDDA912_g10608 [Diaporthe ampelina]|uniref:Uncharacterized protein n=1 Tax=Diaporthe ampelina TaxID=1214573 RepID=A0A0G2F3Y3_9PEZI|nr:hypothetical protein UCDDA912_g10608 [Diaporthe ampelina]
MTRQPSLARLVAWIMPMALVCSCVTAPLAYMAHDFLARNRRSTRDTARAQQFPNPRFDEFCDTTHRWLTGCFGRQRVLHDIFKLPRPPLSFAPSQQGGHHDRHLDHNGQVGAWNMALEKRYRAEIEKQPYTCWCEDRGEGSGGIRKNNVGKDDDDDDDNNNNDNDNDNNENGHDDKACPQAAPHAFFTCNHLAVLWQVHAILADPDKRHAYETEFLPLLASGGGGDITVEKEWVDRFSQVCGLPVNIC